MAKRPPARDDAWLVTADRHVAAAQAEWEAMMIAPPPRVGPRRSRQPRKGPATPTGDHLATADRYITAAEKRLARQATVIGQLAAGDHETSVADGQFWVMGQLLDAMRDRRQRLAEDEGQTEPWPAA